MIEVYDNGKTKTIIDDYNPRIHNTYFRCAGCNSWVHEDCVIWADKNGILNTDTGLAWCDECVPSEEE